VLFSKECFEKGDYFVAIIGNLAELTQDLKSILGKDAV